MTWSKFYIEVGLEQQQMLVIGIKECHLRHKSDVQESLKLLDTESNFVWNDSHHKYQSRKTNNHVSNRATWLNPTTFALLVL
jgi:hypothetical protein